MTTGSRTLITGAGGYLGGLLAQRLVHELGEPVLLWIHAESEAQAEAKIARLRPAYAGREELVTWGWGALEAEDPFGRVATDDLGAIVHGAAIYRFNVEPDVAHRVNVEGTRKVLDLAARCPGLRHVALLSSFYASGLRAGPIAEAPLEPGDAEGFTNAYERSKALAEDEVLARPDLPWGIYRVGLVIADDAGGHVTQHNAFHQTLRLFHGGYMSVMPGDPANRLYLVTGDFVARAVADMVRSPGRHRIVNVVHGPEHGVPLHEVLSTVLEVFREDPAYRRRQLPAPIWTDMAGFEVLLEGLAGFGSPMVRKALQGVATFARQMFVHKVAENGNMREALPWYEPEDQRALVRRASEHLVRSRFSR
ncbi:MAG: SDR family oxidoreductase [Candidatus Sericytochromatia bacterium]|nr:SDR family oxidoreductase [Candidatus Sericytochromatia bacterium]